MSREIMFRAWDTCNKKMVYSGFYIDQFSGNCYWAWEDIEPFDRHGIESCEPQPILMQYTGLKDKNKKEIFEGDILNSKEDSPILVSWNKRFSSFCLDKKGWAFSHWFGESCNPEDCEVIGNIYENAEFVKTAI